MEDFKKHLAEQVLSEEKIITYRALSRALRVDVNVAKQMLYEFHTSQNEKHPRTVHATYMIYGIKKAVHLNGHSSNDHDMDMTSSPPVASLPSDEVPMTTLSLVTEESLADVLSQYGSVTSIHIYSLGPHAVKDMQLLADVSRPILDVLAIDDTVKPPKTLGSIRNPYVRRRAPRGAAPKSVPVPKQADVKPATAKPAPAKSTPAQEVIEEKKADQRPSSKESTPTPSGQAAAKKPTAKRGASGGIMQSFAKAASMPKKPGKVKQETATAAEDSDMQALSDDGDDDSAALPEPREESVAGHKTRKERQEELKRMMEESSDEDDEEPEKEDTPMEEPVEEPPAPEPEEKASEPAEVISSTGGGRRRGKRRVMKKKTVMDEQGYLVTRHEAGWESFSEDEPAPPAKNKTETTSQPAKPKKAAPKGQGNIMSFFGKK